eukprot:1167344_1
MGESGGVDFVKQISANVSDTYSTKFYDSCKDVTYSGTGQKAVAFAFGGADTPLKFLQFMGNQSNAPSPFTIKFGTSSTVGNFSVNDTNTLSNCSQ